jgi:hypothetical protein
VGAVVFGVLAFFVLGYLQPHLEGLKSIAMIMSSLYNMIVLSALLGFGLFNLPVYLWKKEDKKVQLYSELERAETVRSEYRACVTEFFVIVNQCKNMIEKHKSSQNAEFLDILAAELPEKDLEGQTIASSNYFQLDIKKG